MDPDSCGLMLSFCDISTVLELSRVNRTLHADVGRFMKYNVFIKLIQQYQRTGHTDERIDDLFKQVIQSECWDNFRVLMRQHINASTTTSKLNLSDICYKLPPTLSMSWPVPKQSHMRHTNGFCSRWWWCCSIHTLPSEVIIRDSRCIVARKPRNPVLYHSVRFLAKRPELLLTLLRIGWTIVIQQM